MWPSHLPWVHIVFYYAARVKESLLSGAFCLGYGINYTNIPYYIIDNTFMLIVCLFLTTVELICNIF